MHSHHAFSGPGTPQGEYDAAMTQYLETIGQLEPSYVIRRWVGPSCAGALALAPASCWAHASVLPRCHCLAAAPAAVDVQGALHPEACQPVITACSAGSWTRSASRPPPPTWRACQLTAPPAPFPLPSPQVPGRAAHRLAHLLPGAPAREWQRQRRPHHAAAQLLHQAQGGGQAGRIHPQVREGGGGGGKDTAAKGCPRPVL
jgi:hypothetical protein